MEDIEKNKSYSNNFEIYHLGKTSLRTKSYNAYDKRNPNAYYSEWTINSIFEFLHVVKC